MHKDFFKKYSEPIPTGLMFFIDSVARVQRETGNPQPFLPLPLENSHSLVSSLRRELEIGDLDTYLREHFKNRFIQRCSDDRAIIDACGSEFKLLKHHICSALNREDTRALCKKIEDLLADGRYYCSILEELERLIFEKRVTEKVLSRITLLTRDFLVKLSYCGYQDNHLFFPIYELFQKPSWLSHGSRVVKSIIAAFRVDQPFRGMSQLFESMKLRTRFQLLRFFWDPEPEELIYIFRVKGLTRDRSRFKIGEVEFYDPTEHRLTNRELTDSRFEDAELFKKSGESFMNAAVTVRTADHSSSLMIAAELIERAIGYLEIYSTHGYSIELCWNFVPVVEKSGRLRSEISGGFSRDQPDDNFVKHGIRPSSQDNKSLLKFVRSADRISDDARVSAAVKWYRLGHHQREFNEHLRSFVSFWISFECMFSNGRGAKSEKGLTTKQTSFLCWTLLEQMASFLVYQLEYLLSVERNRHDLLVLSPSLEKEWQSIDKADLVANFAVHEELMSAMITSIRSSPMRLSLDEILCALVQPSCATAYIVSRREQLFSELFEIQRKRNLLFHHGNADERFVSALTQRVANWARMFLVDLIRKCETTNTKTSEVLSAQIERFEIFLEAARSGKEFNLTSIQVYVPYEDFGLR